MAIDLDRSSVFAANAAHYSASSFFVDSIDHICYDRLQPIMLLVVLSAESPSNPAKCRTELRNVPVIA